MHSRILGNIFSTQGEFDDVFADLAAHNRANSEQNLRADLTNSGRLKREQSVQAQSSLARTVTTIRPQTACVRARHGCRSDIEEGTPVWAAALTALPLHAVPELASSQGEVDSL